MMSGTHLLETRLIDTRTTQRAGDSCFLYAAMTRGCAVTPRAVAAVLPARARAAPPPPKQQLQQHRLVLTLVALLAPCHVDACIGSTYSYGSSACASCPAGASFISASAGCAPSAAFAAGPADTAFYLSGTQAEGVAAFSLVAAPAGVAFAAGPFGAANGALLLTSGSYLSAAGANAPTALPSGNASWSASAWVKCSASTTYAAVLEWGAAGDEGGCASLQAAALVVQGALGHDQPGVISACDSTWHHVALVFAPSASPNALVAYLDGALAFQQPMTPLVASGGTVSSVGKSTIHTFTAAPGSQTFTVTQSGAAEVLVVAGGGGGGSDRGPGGGAGGLIHAPNQIFLPGSYSIVVGAGGTTSLNGGNSSISGVFTALGGGGAIGCCAFIPSLGGGSGAGGFGQSAPGNGNGFAGALGVPGQGYAGGKGTGFCSGGGGGAGGAGQDAGGGFYNPAGGNGGPGLAFSVSGEIAYYAGGGGGSIAFDYYSGTSGHGIGGIGGGGNSGQNPGANGASGAPNTGGGGGGGANNLGVGSGGSGGSGVVIIRHLSSSQAMTLPVRGSSTLRVGWSGDTLAASLFSGALSDLRIYSRALSSTEVTALSQPPLTAYLAAYDNTVVSPSEPVAGAVAYVFSCTYSGAAATLAKSAADGSWGWTDGATPSCIPPPIPSASATTSHTTSLSASSTGSLSPTASSMGSRSWAASASASTSASPAASLSTTVSSTGSPSASATASRTASLSASSTGSLSPTASSMSSRSWAASATISTSASPAASLSTTVSSTGSRSLIASASGTASSSAAVSPSNTASTSCSAGYFLSGSLCAPCYPGTFALAGAAVCSLCPAGTWGGHAGLATAACSGACAGCAAGTAFPPPSASPAALSCVAADARAVPAALGLQLWPAMHPQNPQRADLVVAPLATCQQMTSAAACAAAASVAGADGVTRYVVGTAAAFNMEADETLTCA